MSIRWRHALRHAYGINLCRHQPTTALICRGGVCCRSMNMMISRCCSSGPHPARGTFPECHQRHNGFPGAHTLRFVAVAASGSQMTASPSGQSYISEDLGELDLVARQLSGADASTSESASFLQPGAIRPSAAGSQRAVPKAHDKVFLTKAEALDVAKRLRVQRPPKGQKLLKIYRYAIDNLRLLKMLNKAGLEGLVTVVDSVAEADVVLATRSKRTGKVVDLAPVRRAAEAAGLPFVQLRAVSPERLLEALAPLLGLEQQVQATQEEGMASRQQPKLLRREEMDGDGSAALLALVWGLGRDTGAQALDAMWEARIAAMPDPLPWVAADLEDVSDHEELLPANPTAWAGNKHVLIRPIKHGARLQRLEAKKVRQELDVPW